MSAIPFTVYDVFAYLSSGIIVLGTFDYLYGRQLVLQQTVGPLRGVLLLLAAYVVGHVAAHLATVALEDLLVARLLKRPARWLLAHPRRRWRRLIFPGYHRPLPQEVRERIFARVGTSLTGDALFFRAYALVTRDERVQQRLDEFRNLYGFSRNLAFSLLIVSGAVFWSTYSDHVLLTPSLPLVVLVLAIAMLYRYLKFFRQYTYEVLVRFAELPDEALGE